MFSGYCGTCWKREQSVDKCNVKTKASEVYQMATQILLLNLRFLQTNT